MNTNLFIYFLLLFYASKTEGIYVLRRKDNDSFRGFKCDNLTNAWNPITKQCDCEFNLKTYISEENQPPYCKADFNGCKINSVTKDTDISKCGDEWNKVITLCTVELITVIEVWDFNEQTGTGSWRTTWSGELNKTVKLSPGFLKINFSIGNWYSLLLRMWMVCKESGDARRCLRIKFTGEREYPLPATNLLQLNGTLVKNDTCTPLPANDNSKPPTNNSNQQLRTAFLIELIFIIIQLRFIVITNNF